MTVFQYINECPNILIFEPNGAYVRYLRTYIVKYNIIQSDSSSVLTDHRPFLIMYNDLSSRSFFSKRLSIIYIEIMYQTYNLYILYITKIYYSYYVTLVQSNRFSDDVAYRFGVPILCYSNFLQYLLYN